MSPQSYHSSKVRLGSRVTNNTTVYMVARWKRILSCIIEDEWWQDKYLRGYDADAFSKTPWTLYGF